jgi:hypothetical protein
MLQSILDAKEIVMQMAFNDSVTQVKDILLEKNEDFWQPLSQLIALLKLLTRETIEICSKMHLQLSYGLLR